MIVFVLILKHKQTSTGTSTRIVSVVHTAYAETTNSTTIVGSIAVVVVTVTVVVVGPLAGITMARLLVSGVVSTVTEVAVCEIIQLACVVVAAAVMVLVGVSGTAKGAVVAIRACDEIT